MASPPPSWATPDVSSPLLWHDIVHDPSRHPFRAFLVPSPPPRPPGRPRRPSAEEDVRDPEWRRRQLYYHRADALSPEGAPTTPKSPPGGAAWPAGLAAAAAAAAGQLLQTVDVASWRGGGGSAGVVGRRAAEQLGRIAARSRCCVVRRALRGLAIRAALAVLVVTALATLFNVWASLGKEQL